MQLQEITRVRVLVAHHKPLVAAGLAAALRGWDDFDVAVQGPGVLDAQDEPDVVVADHETGIRRASANSQRNRARPARVLVMCGELREHEVRRALASGVHGYLPLDTALEEFVHGVRTVAGGSRYLAASTAQCVVDSLNREPLTSRETEVLALLARGQCNKSIARQLDIAIGTVKAHVRAILAKLESTSRTQAVSVAAARGLVSMSGRTGATA